jgi:hypothetical protein
LWKYIADILGKEMAALLARELGPEVMSYAVREVRAAVWEIMADSFAAKSPIVRDWMKVGIDVMLKHMFDQDTHSLKDMTLESWLGLVLFVMKEEPDKLQEATDALIRDPQFITSLRTWAGTIINEIKPLGQRLLHDVVWADIPDDRNIMEWAADLAKRYGITVNEIIAMRADARK